MTRTQPRKGSIAAICAVAMVALVGFTALGVETSLGWMFKKEIQKGLDAATKGGASELDGTSVGVGNAQTMAVTIAASNTAGGNPIAITTSDVIYGVYTSGVGFAPSSDPSDPNINAIRINHSISMGTGFASGAMFGTTSISPAAVAIGLRATAGAPSVKCFLPVAIPNCTVENMFAAGTVQTVDFQFGSTTQNNASWMLPTGANAADLKTYLDMLAGGNCDTMSDPMEISVGDIVPQNNGEVVPAIDSLGALVSASSDYWDTSLWGTQPAQYYKPSKSLVNPWTKVYEAPVAIVSDPDFEGSCSGPLSGNAEVTGFIKAAVYEVVKDGSTKFFTMRLDATTITDGLETGGTGPDYGIVTYPTSNPL
jgi:hypothetical protein